MLFKELQARGLLEQVSDPAIEQLLAGPAVTVYAGFDPTASSLHVGSLMPLIGLVRMQRAGHRPIALMGGATGLIGDPSGKSQERLLLDRDRVEANVAGIRSQVERFLSFEGATAARVVNNVDWFGGISFLEFLRDVGKHFSVNAMIARESVRARLEQREQGISYTEFSYVLLQAYDFLHLFETEGCSFQIGGSDQWGNITAGIDLIRRRRQAHAYGYTLPLITTHDGRKFGKTEEGAVWLDPERTSPYQFHQYFLNTDDRDVGRFLRYFTFLPVEEISALEARSAADPGQREAQRVLAREVTTLLHGRDEADKAEKSAIALFAARRSDAPRSAETLRLAAEGAPSSTVTRAGLDGEGMLLVALLVHTRLCDSNGAARRELAGGGIYLNEERVADAQRRVTAADLVDGDFLLLRRGKKSYHLVRVTEDAPTG